MNYTLELEACMKILFVIFLYESLTSMSLESEDMSIWSLNSTKIRGFFTTYYPGISISAAYIWKRSRLCMGYSLGEAVYKFENYLRRGA